MARLKRVSGAVATRSAARPAPAAPARLINLGERVRAIRLAKKLTLQAAARARMRVFDGTIRLCVRSVQRNSWV